MEVQLALAYIVSLLVRFDIPTKLLNWAEWGTGFMASLPTQIPNFSPYSTSLQIKDPEQNRFSSIFQEILQNKPGFINTMALRSKIDLKRIHIRKYL